MSNCFCCGIVLIPDWPAELRAMARAAAGYFEEELAFQVKNAIRVGPHAQKIAEQRAWLEYIDGLRLQGFTDEQIGFMLQYVPSLAQDRNNNGRPDLLDADSRHPSPVPTPSSVDVPPRNAPAFAPPAPLSPSREPAPTPPRPTPPGRNGIQHHHPSFSENPELD